jgi:glutamate-1-semialdehyde 2,1-aminomutase
MIIIQFLIFLCWTNYYGLRFGFSVIGKSRQLRQKLQGKWLRRYLLKMGPVYIKIGQILATRSDLLNPEIITYLRTLQDDVPPSPIQYIEEILNQELPAPIAEVFEEFNWQPMASASVAQVHSGLLRTGQKVAVKIVKKNVRQDLQKNLKLINFIIKILHFCSSYIRQLNLPTRFQEIQGLLLAQANMRQELQKQKAIFVNFKNHPYVQIPLVFEDWCTESILVMEFIEGVHLKNIEKITLPKEKLARRLQDTLYTMLYMDGLCHGDPHPGNIFFTIEGKIIPIDYGITVELNEDEKWGLSSFYYACTRKEWAIAVDRFTQFFVTEKDQILKNWPKYQQDLEKVLHYHFDVKNDQWSTVGYFQDINQILKKYNACYTTNFTKVELVLLSGEGIVSQIDPKVDIWANACKFTDRFSPYMSSNVKATFDQYFLNHSPHSLKLRQQAHQFLVAPTHLDRFFLPSTYPLFVKRAYQSKFEDVDGNIYIDLSCGYGPHILGYAHPIITEALTEALKLGPINVLGHIPELQLARTITEAFPAADKAIFANSGTEAIIQAFRICRAYRKRDKVAKFEGHYHGFSDQGMISSWFRFTGSKEAPQPIQGALGTHSQIVQNTLVLQYGHPASLERLREQGNEIACVICEPMPTALADYNQPFLQALREICTEFDIPLIFDEVVSGFRVAYGGIQNLINIAPDLTCLGKIIGGGLACGSVIGRRQLIDIAKTSEDPFTDYETKTFVGGTMSGNFLTCVAGLTVLTYLKEHPEIYNQLQEKTQNLATQLRQIADSHHVPFQIRANHSIFSFTFSYKKTKLYREKLSGSNFKANVALAYYMRKYGVYLPELHTLMLNAAHTQEDLDLVGRAFDQSLTEMVADGFFAL